MKLRLAAACAAALLAAACQTASAPGPVLAAPMAAAPPELRITVPDGPGPYPAVLLVPDCTAPLASSRAALFTRYAEQLKAEGFAAGIVSWRGAAEGDPACLQMAPPREIAEWIARSAARLAEQPGVDPRRLHIVGWGRGGRGVLEAVMAKSRLPGLVSAVAVYPDCPAPQVWSSEVTLFLALAEHDTANPPAACRAWAEKSDGPGPVAITRYTGVAHGFDVNEAADPAFAAWMTGTPLTYDAPTAWQFWLDLLKFLRLKIDAGA
ncbi:MAG: dienelactone hydrolase family protein [Micropepsaceae bacterium]